MGPSTTTASGNRLKRSCHRRQMMRSVLADETMGIRLMLLSPTEPGRLSGRPAPEMIMSAFSSTAALTRFS